MQRFRAFSSAGWDDDIGLMERAINAWLETAAEAASVADMFEREIENSSGHAEADLAITLPLMDLPY